MGVKINKALTTNGGLTVPAGSVVCASGMSYAADKKINFNLRIAKDEASAIAHQWIDDFVSEFDSGFVKEFSKLDFLALTQPIMEQEVLDFIKDNNTGGIVVGDLSIVDTIPNDV